MDSLAAARRLNSVGRYREALEELQSVDTHRSTLEAQLLRAELLTITGQPAQALQILQQLDKAKLWTDSERSHSEFIRSRIAKEEGNFDGQLQHLQRSLAAAERAHDLERTCLAQLHLIGLVADRSGPDSVGTLVTATRENATRLGDPTITAMLHVVVG